MSYTDPAVAYQRVLIEKGQEGTFQQIGNFKVIGSQFLFGEQLLGSAFIGNQMSSKIKLGYNLFNQTAELYMSDNSLKIIKNTAELDSFVILAGQSDYIYQDLKFHSSKLYPSSLKDCFLQQIYKGSKYSLFKSYTATLDYVSTNYIQSELRQFTVDYLYYYYDHQKKSFKKIKLSKRKLSEEFNSFKVPDNLVEDAAYDLQPETAAQLIFQFINQ
jgi:hypothetical protein